MPFLPALSRRRAVRRALADAGLPAEIASFIGRIAVRARLRAEETADVAAELASHFAEGLADGRRPDELIRLYGDPGRSARELRRSAIAKRGPVDRAIGASLRWTGRGVLALTGLYAISAAVLHFKRPVLSLDAVAALRSTMPVVGSEGRALDLYREALADAEGHLDLDTPAAALATLDDDIARLESDPDARARAREALASIAGRVTILRRLGAHPVLGLALESGGLSDEEDARFFRVASIAAGLAPDADGPPAIAGVLLPQLPMLRGASRWLAADAGLAAHDGRVADFVEDLEALVSMAAHAEEASSLISTLVSSAIRVQLLLTLVSAIENHAATLDDATLARLDALARVQRVDLARAFAAEQLFQLDVVQRCYSDDGAGGGVLLVSPTVRQLGGLQDGTLDGPSVPAVLNFLGGPLAAIASPGRAAVEKRIRDAFAALVAACSAPTRREARDHIARSDSMLPDSPRGIWQVADPLRLLMPALGRTVGAQWRLDAARDSAVAAIAIERFHRANGRFPADLAELREAAGVPVGDWFDDIRPWRYAVVDGRPLLHDCGIDRMDDRARTQIAAGFDDAVDPATSLPPRFASLVAAAGDGELDGPDGSWAPSLRFERRVTAITPDAPLDPARPVLDDDPYALSPRAGDAVRVWWKSGAAGPARIVRARDPRPLAVGAEVDVGDVPREDAPSGETSGEMSGATSGEPRGESAGADAAIQE